ncbi:MAG: hypothetical protein WC483_05500 [Candidatus Paceibacterota bacterium]
MTASHPFDKFNFHEGKTGGFHEGDRCPGVHCRVPQSPGLQCLGFGHARHPGLTDRDSVRARHVHDHEGLRDELGPSPFPDHRRPPGHADGRRSHPAVAVGDGMGSLDPFFFRAIGQRAVHAPIFCDKIRP